MANEPIVGFWPATEMIIEVTDVSRDPRFFSARWLRQNPRIRFCAAAPIRGDDGELRGSLLVMAHDARTLTDAQRAALIELAGLAAVALKAFATRPRSSDHPLAPMALIADSTPDMKLELAVRANRIGTWELDLNSGHLQWDDVMFEIFGASRETFTGRETDWLQTVHPADVQRLQTELRVALQSLDAFDSEYRIRHSDGTLHHIHAQALVVRDELGHPRRLLGSNRDISARVRAQHALERSERRLRLITDKLPVLIASVDKDYRYTFANNNFEAWYQLGGRGMAERAVQSVIGKTTEEVFGTVAFMAIKPYLDQAMLGNEISIELDMPPSNTPPHIFLYCAPERDEMDSIVGVFGLVLDRTPEYQAREKIAESEYQLRTVTDNLPALIAYIDANENIQFCNQTFCDWHQTSKKEVTGKSVAELEGPLLYAKRKEYLKSAMQGDRIEFEAQYECKNEPVHLHTTLVPDKELDGSVKGIFKLCTDVTKLKHIEDELRNLAKMDSLTGLPNRSQFNETLKAAAERSQCQQSLAALLFLDIDHFKQINDCLGHAVGDLVLSEFARRIKSSLRSTDTVARLAGDEFVVILEDLSSADQALAIASKIMACVRQPMWLERSEVQVTTSVGVACYQTDEGELSAWLARADKALYQAKAAGRDTVRSDPARFMS